jgi:hypothetical protein
MPDFTVDVTYGVVVEPYAEDGSDDWQNPLPDHPPNRLRITSTTVDFDCTVGGVATPMDTALGGRLFLAWVVEWPDPAAPEPYIYAPFAGQSSRWTLDLTSSLGGAFHGHYVVAVYRDGGGAVLVHLDLPA